MLKRTLYICLTLLLGTVSAPAFGFESDHYLLEDLSIIIEGGRANESQFEAIRSRLKSREGAVFSQEDFDADLKVLSRDFNRVIPDLRYEGEKVFVCLHVWPKPFIRSIYWSGNEAFKTSKLESELAVPKGEVFDRMAFSQAFHKLKSYYVGKGYFEAELSYSTVLDAETHEVDITINIDEGRCGHIRDIKFVNFFPGEKQDLIDMITTKRFNMLTSWMTGEGTFRDDMVQQDEFIILNYIHNRGFADARVKIDIEEVGKLKQINVVVTLDRGQRYRFGEVSFDGNDSVGDDIIQSLMTVGDGEPFSPDDMRETVRRISDYYGARGYVDTYVTFEPVIRSNEPTYDVQFHVIEGQLYRVGMIKVFGNITTCPEVILHETLLVPGEVFDTQKLKLTELRLKNIGFFDCVNVYAVQSENEDVGFGGPLFRDVHIEVEEASTGDLGFSAGYSTSESAFIGFHFTERNFNYRGLPCLFSDGYRAIRGGGQHLTARVNFGSQNSKYVLSWTEPYFRDSDWSVGFDVDRSSYQTGDKGYEVNGQGFGLHAIRSLNQFVKVAWHYRMRDTYVDISQVEKPSQKLQRDAQNSGLISATGISLIYDSTNHPAMPTCGFRSRLSLEYAGVGGRHNFWNVSYLNSYYYSPERDFIVKLRADARFLKPVDGSSLGSLPIDERLFLGGEDSVRGYAYNGIGPHYPDDEPSGGLSLMVFSVEYVWKAFSRADLFSFFDSGMLSEGEVKVRNFRASTGFGARLYVFPGGPPLMLGVGHPINARPGDKTKELFISMGGRF